MSVIIMKKVKIRVGFFAIVILMFMLISKNEYIFLTLLAVTIHEMGHVIAAWCFKIEISEFSLSILGARLKPSNCLTSYYQEILLCSFGPLFNFLTGLSVYYFVNSSMASK